MVTEFNLKNSNSELNINAIYRERKREHLLVLYMLPSNTVSHLEVSVYYTLLMAILHC